jgi:hypothetical protein
VCANDLHTTGADSDAKVANRTVRWLTAKEYRKGLEGQKGPSDIKGQRPEFRGVLVFPQEKSASETHLTRGLRGTVIRNGDGRDQHAHLIHQGEAGVPALRSQPCVILSEASAFGRLVSKYLFQLRI